MSIRAATVDDLPAIVALGAQLHQHSSYARYAFDGEKVTKLMRTLVLGGGVIYVAERNGELVGGIAGGVTEFWFGPGLHGFDYSFFIVPEHRHGVTALRLLLTFERWCAIKGATEMRIGITTGIDVEGTARFYEWQGYTRNGALFTKELERGH